MPFLAVSQYTEADTGWDGIGELRLEISHILNMDILTTSP